MESSDECRSVAMPAWSGSPTPANTAPGAATARATTSRTALWLGSPALAARQPAMKVSSTNTGARPPGAGFARRLEDRLHFRIVERRNHRRRHHAGRDAGLGERLDRGDALRGRRGARLHGACEVALERGHRDEDLAQPPRRHGRD